MSANLWLGSGQVTEKRKRRLNVGADATRHDVPEETSFGGRTGLPDFCCYNISKRGKIYIPYILPENIQNAYKIFQMVVK
jgi:hypothetical protein